MVIEFVFISDILPIAQRLFPFWEGKPGAIFLSDLMFIEAGLLLVFGALTAGVILYSSWAALDVRKVQFTEYIWNWRKMKEERNSPAGIIIGLALIVVGIIYVLVSILISAGLVPSL
jgi:hypothetical protein